MNDNIVNLHTQFLNPDRAKDFLTQADIHAKSKNYQKAIESLRESFKYQPNSVEGHLLGAKIYMKVGMYDTAAKFLDNLHQHSPPTEESLLLKAKVDLFLDKLEDCDAALQDIFANRRDHFDALLLLADLYFKQLKYTEAISIYERLHDKDKSNHEIIYSLALAYFKIKDFNETINYCSILKSAGPSRAVEDLYDQALKEVKQDYLKKKGFVTWLDRLRVFIHDPFTNEEIRVHSQTERINQKANKKNFMDENTGALNFRAMNEYVPIYLQGSKNEFYLCHMDIDFFKLFNDKYSHGVGDIVLKVVTQMGGTAFPQRFFRTGGEEFIWVLDAKDEPEAIEKARAFRTRVEKYAASEANNMIVNQQLRKPKSNELFQIKDCITITQGLARYKQDGRNPTELIGVADQNQHLGKEYGRNCIVYKGVMIDQGEKPEKPVMDSR